HCTVTLIDAVATRVLPEYAAAERVYTPGQATAGTITGIVVDWVSPAASVIARVPLILKSQGPCAEYFTVKVSDSFEQFLMDPVALAIAPRVTVVELTVIVIRAQGWAEKAGRIRKTANMTIAAPIIIELRSIVPPAVVWWWSSAFNITHI